MNAYRDELAAAREQNEALRQRLRSFEEGNAIRGVGLRLHWIPPAMLGLLCGSLLVLLTECGAKPHHEAVGAASPYDSSALSTHDDGTTHELGIEPGGSTSPAMSGDAVFYGQYWLAEVGASATALVSRGDPCIVTLREGAFNGAGLVTIHCREQMLFSGVVSPPERPRGRGGPCAYHDDGHLNCSPFLLDGGSNPQMCWIDTASGRASCANGVELRFRSRVRDPRVRSVPSWARNLEMPEGPRVRRQRREALRPAEKGSAEGSLSR